MRQQGNALFLILISVALFAALSYAVTQSGRSGGSADKEKTIIHASEIVEYAASLQYSVMRMSLLGTVDTNFSFANSFDSGYEHTPPQPSENQVFSTNGGSVPYMVPKTEWLETSNSAETTYQKWYFPPNVCIMDIPEIDSAPFCYQDTTGSSEDIVVFLTYLKKDICIEINNKLGVVNPGGNPPIDVGSSLGWAYEKFTGVFSDAVSIDRSGQLDGEYTACFESGNVPVAGTYHFYNVLKARE